MNDRRHFLRNLGLTAAIVPAAAESITREPELLTVEPPTLPPTLGLKSPEQLLGVPSRGELGPWVLSPGFLYSGLTMPRNTLLRQEWFNFVDRYLFCDSIGSTGPHGEVTTLNETNMVRGNQLPPPQYFAVERVGIIFSPTTLPAVRGVFADRYILEFQIADWIAFRSPVAALFSTGEPEVASGAAVFSAESLRGSAKLDVPVLIEPQCFFRVRLSGPAMPANPKIKLWGFLQGRRLTTAQ